MQSYFIFNNINSKDMGIVVNKLPQILKAERNAEKVEVLGRDGFITEDYGTYKGIVKSVECTIKNTDKINEICTWLDGVGEVIFSNEDDKIYRATIINQIPFEKIIREYYSFIIQFDCQPFKYARNDVGYFTTLSYNVERNSIVINPLSSYNFVNGELIPVNTAIEINKMEELKVYNVGTVESKPILTLYGTGDITIHLNDKDITLTNVEGSIIIDSELMECYKDTQLCNNKMYGEFPILQLGENILTWESNLTAIKIKHNTCYL